MLPAARTPNSEATMDKELEIRMAEAHATVAIMGVASIIRVLLSRSIIKAEDVETLLRLMRTSITPERDPHGFQKHAVEMIVAVITMTEVPPAAERH